MVSGILAPRGSGQPLACRASWSVTSVVSNRAELMGFASESLSAMVVLVAPVPPFHPSRCETGKLI